MSDIGLPNYSRQLTVFGIKVDVARCRIGGDFVGFARCLFSYRKYQMAFGELREHTSTSHRPALKVIIGEIDIVVVCYVSCKPKVTTTAPA